MPSISSCRRAQRAEGSRSAARGACGHQATTYPARALIVGSGPDEAKFKRQARRLGLNGKVSFAGSLAGAKRVLARDVASWFRPARNRFPISCSKPPRRSMPLIATNVGGIPEIVAGSRHAACPAGRVAGACGPDARLPRRPEAVPRSRRRVAEASSRSASRWRT